MQTNTSVHFAISRTDNIGDVVLTFPMLYLIKQALPHCKITFIGKGYTQSIIENCIYVDHFFDVNKLESEKLTGDVLIHVFPNKYVAQKLKKEFTITIGTARRWFHWPYCNYRVNFSRKKSELHEAQLNTFLLTPLSKIFKTSPLLERHPSLDTIRSMQLMKPLAKISEKVQRILKPGKKLIIFHPLSNLSAPEWGLDNFKQLALMIQSSCSHPCQIFVTGTMSEYPRLKALIEDKDLSFVQNTIGQFNLAELMELIAHSDGFVSSSTGPLHIAAAMGKTALGLYCEAPIIGPKRWAPLGKKARYLSAPRGQNLSQLPVTEVYQTLMSMVSNG